MPAGARALHNGLQLQSAHGQTLGTSSTVLLHKSSKEALSQWLARCEGRCYKAPASAAKPRQFGPCRIHGFQENGILLSLPGGAGGSKYPG